MRMYEELDYVICAIGRKQIVNIKTDNGSTKVT